MQNDADIADLFEALFYLEATKPQFFFSDYYAFYCNVIELLLLGSDFVCLDIAIIILLLLLKYTPNLLRQKTHFSKVYADYLWSLLQKKIVLIPWLFCLYTTL